MKNLDAIPQKFFAVALFLACIHTPLANASSFTLAPTDSGQITGDGYRVPFPVILIRQEYSHQSALNNMLGSQEILGPDPLHTGPGITQGKSGYLIYDLSHLNFSPTGAYLEFDLTGQGALGNLNIWSADSVSANDLSNLATGPLSFATGSALAADLNGGQLYGFAALSAGNTVFQMSLNPAALAAISGSTGLLALGISHVPFDGISSYRIDFNESPRLVLKGKPLQVPLPPYLTLLLIASITVTVARLNRVTA